MIMFDNKQNSSPANKSHSNVLDLPDDTKVHELSQKFANASPFPHISIDEIFSDHVKTSDVKIPDFNWDGWTKFTDSYQYGKRSCNDISKLPDNIREIIIEASSPRFLSFLEKLTGISKLIPDPYLTGGGIHSSGSGGVLTPHSDFHIYEKLSLYRRLNVLIYLNTDWTEHDGGNLELYSKIDKSPEVSIVPIFGRMTIFKTDDVSIHGFTKPIAEGKQRSSIALYYYTSREAGIFSGDHATHWRLHNNTRFISRIRLNTYKLLLLISRVFSMLAHKINPNFE
jgi:Rps23 Pro-64 3,4-dihydroxylase Tpa1-like proline 4-hydroxylase